MTTHGCCQTADGPGSSCAETAGFLRTRRFLPRVSLVSLPPAIRSPSCALEPLRRLLSDGGSPSSRIQRIAALKPTRSGREVSIRGGFTCKFLRVVLMNPANSMIALLASAGSRTSPTSPAANNFFSREMAASFRYSARACHFWPAKCSGRGCRWQA